MLSWGTITYGAALSAVLAVLLVAFLARERRPVVLVSTAAGAFAGPVAWNAILRATGGSTFFVDAPIPVFPISWQDTGSGVFALAALTLLLGFGPLRAAPGRRVALLAGVGAVGALLVDIYLY
jgi:hypothetical protein